MKIKNNGFTLIRLLLANARRSCKGFTLIELLVVVSIIITMTALALPRLTAFKESQDLTTEQGKLLTAIKEAQNNALSGFRCGDTFDPKERATDWHLLINDSSYSIEPTCPGDNVLQLPKKTVEMTVGVTLDLIGFDNGSRSADPPEGLDLEGVTMTSTGGAKIVFSNIGGEVSFVDSSNLEILNYKRAIITLQTIDQARGAVFVEKGGLIYTGRIR